MAGFIRGIRWDETADWRLAQVELCVRPLWAPVRHLRSSDAVEELVGAGRSFSWRRSRYRAGAESRHASYIANWLKVLKNDKRAIHHGKPRATGVGFPK